MMRSLMCLCVFSLSLLTTPLFAAEVLKVKGKSVLIDLKGDPASPGDMFYALKADGKRAAVIQIGKVKGEKAIGKITKGKAQVGMALELKGNQVVSRSKSRSYVSPVSDGRSYWGAIFGYGMDSMTVNINDSLDNHFIQKGDLSGSGFSVKGLFDYELFPQVWFRGTSGLEMFNVAGPSKCGALNQQACNAKINYLSFDFVGRYVFSNSQIRPWLGGGLGLLFPASKSASALQASSIATTNVMMLVGGVDWFLNPNMYVPISIEYGMLPKSDEVEAKWIALRAGIAVPF